MRKLALLAAAVAGMATFSRPPESPPPETIPHVVTSLPGKKALPRRLLLPGEVRPNQEVVLHARVQGYLESIAVDRGDRATRGQVLARIAVPELEKQLAREEAELALCPALTARDEADRAAREAVWKRLQAVAQKTPNLVSGVELDETGGRARAAAARLEVTRAREGALRAAVERTRALIEFATIRAPSDGYVTDRWVDPGSLVQAASTPLVRITQVDPVRVRIRVPESDALLVRPDTRVRVEFEGVPVKPFEGRVARLFWALRPKTRTMAVEIDVPNPGGAIRPGMTANVALPLEERAGAIVLEATALVTELRRVDPPRKEPTRRELAAEVVPFQDVGLFSRVQGYLESIRVDRGDRVRAGDVLAKIAVPELEKELAEREADLALSPLQAALDEAERAWKEAVWKNLSETARRSPHLVNQDVLDRARGDYESAGAQLETTRAREASLRAAAARVRAMVELSELRAPFDAIVTERWADPGHLAHPASTKLLHLVQVDPVRVRFYLPQADVSYLSPKGEARIAFDFSEVAGEPFQAPVSRLFWSLNPETKTMSTEVDLPNPQGAIRPGMSARVAIEVNRPEEAKRKPRPVERAEHFVFVVREGRAAKVAVQIGYDNGIEFEVTKGLTGAEEVIVLGKNLVTDGVRVRTSKRP